MEHIKDQDYIETCDLTLKYELQEALEIIKFYPFVCDKRKDGNRYAMVLDKLSELQ